MEINVSQKLEKNSDNIKEELGDVIKELNSHEGSVMDMIKEMTPAQVATVLKNNYRNKDTNSVSRDHGRAAMIQTALNHIDNEKFKDDPDYQPLLIDGIYGPKTKGAVIMFQLENGGDGEGWAGPKTIEKLITKLEGLNGNVPETTQSIKIEKTDSTEAQSLLLPSLDTLKETPSKIVKNTVATTVESVEKKSFKKEKKNSDPLALFGDEALLEEFLKGFKDIKVKDFAAKYGNDAVIKQYLDDYELGTGTTWGAIPLKGSFHARRENGQCIVSANINLLRSGNSKTDIGIINLEEVVREGSNGYEIDTGKLFSKIAVLIQKRVAKRNLEIQEQKNKSLVKEVSNHSYKLEDLGIPMDYRAKAFLAKQNGIEELFILTNLEKSLSKPTMRYTIGLSREPYVKGFTIGLDKIVDAGGNLNESKWKAILKEKVIHILDTQFTKGKSKNSETA